ncbi:MAG TPA: hypothetical protein VKD72_15675, partial [Gemmataceae bacterium]|nr:hypothetical protein [Gemmataceae bacterium]
MFRYALRALLPCVLAVALTALGPAARADLIDKAGLFQDDTAAKANELIGRMKADCGKDLVIETVEKPDWADPEWATKPPTKDFKSGASDPAHVVG